MLETEESVRFVAAHFDRLSHDKFHGIRTRSHWQTSLIFAFGILFSLENDAIISGCRILFPRNSTYWSPFSSVSLRDIVDLDMLP